MISVTISVGSNCGNREESVKKAVGWLRTILLDPKCSSVYETPCALKAGKPYMNAVIEGFFSGDAFQLNDLLKEKEREMGRNSQCREKGDVPIDMDIVICDREVFKSWDFRQKFFQFGYAQIKG